MASRERAFTATNNVITAYGAELASYKYEYDECSNLSKLTCAVAGSTWSTVYTYDDDNRPKTTTLQNNTVITNTFDTLNRLTKRTIGLNTDYETKLTYYWHNGDRTAVLCRYYNGEEDPYLYDYDDNGNITSITRGTTSITYEYDEANRMTRENNSILNQTIVYDYDRFGNITQKKLYAYTTAADPGTPTSTIPYAYGNPDWADQLTSYNNTAIAYDAMGNPLSYRGYTFGWRGKQLVSASNGTDSLTFAYNEDGLRQQKTVNNTATDYFYNGSVLIGLQRGTDKLLFSYDASGSVVSVNYNGDDYYYLRDGQGNVVELIDEDGDVVVQYTYDTWGKKVQTTGTLASTLGVLQPFRYRGYVYDEETGLYYLQSRYYDPTTGRFVSADVMLSTGQGVLGHNAYAYCGDNPVIRIDTSGNFWIEIILIGVLVIGLGATTGCTNSNDFGIETENRGNCYQYATGLPYSILDGGLYYPGYTTGYSEYERFDSAEKLRKAVQGDYNSGKKDNEYTYTVTICDSTTEVGSNEWIIAYCYSDESFHFLRYDKDKKWTHKRGWNAAPSNLDWSSNPIDDPSTADLGPYLSGTLIYLKITKSKIGD